MSKYKQQSGNIKPPLVECINPLLNIYHVNWEINKYSGKRGDSYTWWSYKFYKKPTIDEIKEAIIGWYNSECDKEILSGFRFEGNLVWLSSENQFNYKAAFDLAVQTGGQSLPVTFKFGPPEQPVYREFRELQDLQGFYIQAMGFVNQVLQKYWTKKDEISWIGYME